MYTFCQTLRLLIENIQFYDVAGIMDENAMNDLNI